MSAFHAAMTAYTADLVVPEDIYMSLAATIDTLCLGTPGFHAVTMAETLREASAARGHAPEHAEEAVRWALLMQAQRGPELLQAAAAARCTIADVDAALRVMVPLILNECA